MSISVDVNSSSWGVCGNFMKWLWIPHLFRISSPVLWVFWECASLTSYIRGPYISVGGGILVTGHLCFDLWFTLALLCPSVWRRNKGGLCGYLVCHLGWKSNFIIYKLIPLCWMDCKFIHSIYNSLRLLIPNSQSFLPPPPPPPWQPQSLSSRSVSLFPFCVGVFNTDNH